MYDVVCVRHFVFGVGDVFSYRNLTEEDCEFILKHWVGRSIVFKK